MLIHCALNGDCVAYTTEEDFSGTLSDAMAKTTLTFRVPGLSIEEARDMCRTGIADDIADGTAAKFTNRIDLSNVPANEQSNIADRDKSIGVIEKHVPLSQVKKNKTKISPGAPRSN